MLFNTCREFYSGIEKDSVAPIWQDRPITLLDADLIFAAPVNFENNPSIDPFVSCGHAEARKGGLKSKPVTDD